MSSLVIACLICIAVGAVCSKPIGRALGWLVVHFVYAPWWLLGNGGLRQGIPVLGRYYFKRWDREAAKHPRHPEA